MSQGDKSALYKALTQAGWKPEKHYREYSTSDLETIANQMLGEAARTKPADPEPKGPIRQEPPRSRQEPSRPAAPVVADMGIPIRVDPDGKVWYADEVRKLASPGPRKRRKLSYVDRGTKVETVQIGQFMESFEVAGSDVRTEEVKITLPTYQVGLYRDPRLPFLIHIYNNNRGYDLFEVIKYYGNSADLVPQEIQKTYVGNDLCYDIKTTNRAIENEARQLRMRGLLK